VKSWRVFVASAVVRNRVVVRTVVVVDVDVDFVAVVVQLYCHYASLRPEKGDCY